MVRAGLGYLAAADAAQLPAATQAEALRELERHDAMATAARASCWPRSPPGQGPAGDGDYSAVSWLIHRTGITRGAAVGHSAWAKRTATHPRVLAALAAGQVSESVGRVICLWTGKLPQEYRDAGDEQLLAAFAGGLGLADLAALFAEMYVRARGDLPDQDPGREFADREVKLATTIGGAGVMHGDLTGGVRRGGGGGAGRAVRPGREGRRPDQGPAVPRRAGRGDAPADRQPACSRSGPGSRSRPGRTSPWPTCSCWTATPPCRRSGPSRSGPGGPPAARTPSETGAATARGWTGTPPRRSRATPRWRRS